MIHQPIPELDRLRIFAGSMGHYRRKKNEEIAKLLQVIQNTQNENTRRKVAESLSKTDPGNPNLFCESTFFH